MEATDLSACLLMNDDLLDFNLNDDEEDDDKLKVLLSPSFSNRLLNDHSPSFPEIVEEELEWISNKDAFPALETCLDILSNPSGIISNKKTVKSVSEKSSSCSNSNNTIANCCTSIQVPVSYPVRPRSKRRRKRRKGFPELPSQQCKWWDQENTKKNELTYIPLLQASKAISTIGRRCQHCLAEKTPQWRAGPMGPKTLCNACGVRFKSGRLVPEYRPASSPTFSSMLHSNSHRKIVEMRKHKPPGGMTVNEGGYSVG